MQWALELQKVENKLFWDSTSGGYFESVAGADDVLIRMKVLAEKGKKNVALWL